MVNLVIYSLKKWLTLSHETSENLIFLLIGILQIYYLFITIYPMLNLFEIVKSNLGNDTYISYSSFATGRVETLSLGKIQYYSK